MTQGFSSMREQGKVRTPLYCHECKGNFVAVLDYDLDGNHVVNCPECGHEHCRVIKAGVVTSDRWAQRNGPTHSYTTSTSTVFVMTGATTTTICSGTGAGTFLAASWLNWGTNT